MYWKVSIPQMLLFLSFSEKQNRLGVFCPVAPRVLFTYMILISRWVIFTFPCLNFNFFKWHKTETWTSDRSWKKEVIDDIFTLVMDLRCDVRTRHDFEKVAWSSWWLHHLTLPIKGYPQYKFQLHTQSRSWKMERSVFFACETWSVNYSLVLRIWSLLTKCFYCQ